MSVYYPLSKRRYSTTVIRVMSTEDVIDVDSLDLVSKDYVFSSVSGGICEFVVNGFLSLGRESHRTKPMFLILCWEEC